MTTDSFFTARNSFDHQVANWMPGTCEEVMEAAARRMLVKTGPRQTAERIQRLADIVAGSFVSAELEAIILDATKAKSPAPKAERLAWYWRAWKVVVGNPGAVFWAGVFVGLWIGAR